jgi:hypothetical protein
MRPYSIAVAPFSSLRSLKKVVNIVISNRVADGSDNARFELRKSKLGTLGHPPPLLPLS